MIDRAFIDDMRLKARSTDPYEQYLALLFVLQLPSICARIEFPRDSSNTGNSNQDPNILYPEKGRPYDRKLYFAWLNNHRGNFLPWYYSFMPFCNLCQAIYELRNSVTHVGSLFELDSKIVLVEPGAGTLFSGKRLYLSLDVFCDAICNATWNSFWRDHAYKESIVVNESSSNSNSYMLPKDIFDNIHSELTAAYRKYWDGRDDDLKLYNEYCIDFVGRTDTIYDKLKTDPVWIIGGATRKESERLAEIICDVDDFSSKLEDEITAKYLEKYFLS